METRSYPISVRVTGVMHKEKSKVRARAELEETRLNAFKRPFSSLQMYMTSVLWSDHDEVVVYRTFQEFKKMHVSGAHAAGVDVEVAAV